MKNFLKPPDYPIKYIPVSNRRCMYVHSLKKLLHELRFQDVCKSTNL